MTKSISQLAVLVADPSSHMASLVAAMLRTLKIRTIREVTETSAILFELRRSNYDVLMLDDNMGGIGSVAFTKKLRATADFPGRDMPIIMMSAAPGARDIKAARDAGVTEFLRKPFSAQHIESRLKAILGAPREFIAAPAYAGPDRRRKAANYSGKERRGSSETEGAA